MKQKRRHTEQSTQMAVAKFLHLAAPADLFWTAINPKPHKNRIVASICKAMGMRAGVADLLFVYEGRVMFVEMKRPKGGTESDEQIATRALAERSGAATAVARSVGEVESRLRFWGVPLRATVMTALEVAS